MSRSIISTLSSFHPNSGIEAISRQSAPQPEFFSWADLKPTEAPDQSQLELQFRLQSYEDFIRGRLTPTFGSSGFIAPARFRSSLKLLRYRLQHLAKQKQASARRFGRLAQLLDDQDELARLAQMYFSSVLRG